MRFLMIQKFLVIAATVGTIGVMGMPAANAAEHRSSVVALSEAPTVTSPVAVETVEAQSSMELKSASGVIGSGPLLSKAACVLGGAAIWGIGGSSVVGLAVILVAYPEAVAFTAFSCYLGFK